MHLKIFGRTEISILEILLLKRPYPSAVQMGRLGEGKTEEAKSSGFVCFSP